LAAKKLQRAPRVMRPKYVHSVPDLTFTPKSG
jgi:hypothetical protein